MEARDLEDALAIQKGCGGGRFTAGAPVRRRRRAVANVNAVLGARLAGVRQRRETAAALKREVRGRYEAAVARGNEAALSELTPLLRLLDMTELDVRLYLRYLRVCLCQNMVFETPDCAALSEAAPAVDLTGVPQEGSMSHVTMRCCKEERCNKEAHKQSAPAHLACIYNVVSCFEFLT